ncbi:MAG: NAD-dependent protein deacylase [Oscillospiraceae bacterium]|nr:NAD-dependent protein deacylase [Oscillospiraceae bacterium]
MDKIETLQKWIDSSGSTVFFGGAGVSTESGIPDFRSTDGLYSMKYRYPPEQIISHEFFFAKTAEFYEFYRDKLIAPQAKPNMAHIKLAQLEKAGRLDSVITQNIDGLHQLAGSRNVFELHGCVNRNYCLDCGKLYDSQYIMNSGGVPHCECGGLIKPDVVLYNEGLDDSIVENSVKAISNAELLIVGGTSLVVYPAAGLLRYFKGKKLVIINKSQTQLDSRCDLVICEPIGDVFSKIRI